MSKTKTTNILNEIVKYLGWVIVAVQELVKVIAQKKKKGVIFHALIFNKKGKEKMTCKTLAEQQLKLKKSMSDRKSLSAGKGFKILRKIKIPTLYINFERLG